MAFTNSNNNGNSFNSKSSSTFTSSLNNKSGTSSGSAFKTDKGLNKTGSSSAFTKPVSSAFASSDKKTFSSFNSGSAFKGNSTLNKGTSVPPKTTNSIFNKTATSTATKTTTTSSVASSFKRPSALTSVSSATAARPSALSSTSSSFANKSTSKSTFTSTLGSKPSTLSSTSSSFRSTSQGASSFKSTSSFQTRTPTSRSSVSTSSHSNLGNPISNDEFAKKFADTKAALSANTKKVDVFHHQGVEGEQLATSQEVTDVQYRRFSAFIEEKCGIVLGSGKQYLVNSRLSALLPKFHISNIDELINHAMEEKPNNKIQEAVVDAMTTNETLWFRDTYPYTALEQFILPELAKKGKYPVRIWSAACSSGQEPYSIGIVVQEQMAKMLHVDPKQTQIIGTDLSPEMLSTCKLGQYDVHALSRGLSAERKSKFFKPTRNPNLMQIDPRVKSMVEFRPMNLLGSYALMGRFDVIFCRNVLIYFSNDVKAEILRKLTMCLNPRGYLILGSTETLVGVADKYEMIRHSPGILYRLKADKFAFS